MKLRSQALLSLSVILFASPALAQQREAFGAGYEELKPEQKRLFDDLVTQYAKLAGRSIEPRQAFERLPLSVRTTFDAVTHALLATRLTDAGGSALGNPLELIQSIETVKGKVQGARGDAQFRVYALMKPDAMEILGKSQQFRRAADNSVYHKGYPICFRQSDGLPSIQFSIARDHKRADIDVDYRSSTFPMALVNGHLSASNSDVRVGPNFDRHSNRWSGLNNWWKDLISFDIVQAAAPTSEETQALATVPRRGNGKLEEAVADFLTAWLVEGNANQAVGYFSEDAFSCWELKGMTGGEPLNRGLAPYFAFLRLRDSRPQIESRLGTITGLPQVVQGVRIAGAQDLQVVQQPNHERFVLYDLPEGRALEWACSVRISGAQAPKKDSKRHGRYFASVFRIPPGGVGTTIGLLWAKENGYWKILSFETEADNDYSNVPDLRSKTVSGEPRKTFQADPEFLHAARQFHRNWFTRRMYDAALRVISPDTMGCVQFYMRPGETPPATWEQTVERWRMGMQRTTDQTGPQRELADAIRYVEPTDSRIAVVPHPDQDAFTIFALSDELGLAAQCSNRKSAHPEPPASLREAPAKGNYFATSFEIETAGGAPASFFAFWRKNKDLWEIYSYHVETP